MELLWEFLISSFLLFKCLHVVCTFVSSDRSLFIGLRYTHFTLHVLTNVTIDSYDFEKPGFIPTLKY